MAGYKRAKGLPGRVSQEGGGVIVEGEGEEEGSLDRRGGGGQADESAPKHDAASRLQPSGLLSRQSLSLVSAPPAGSPSHDPPPGQWADGVRSWVRKQRGDKCFQVNSPVSGDQSHQRKVLPGLFGLGGRGMRGGRTERWRGSGRGEQKKAREKGSGGSEERKAKGRVRDGRKVAEGEEGRAGKGGEGAKRVFSVASWQATTC
ncbi:unnamed protein product [Pleuronectes platessa]|uniref:Uncharacterized protein n=1 Tax=Pleuronectes platessa TaxID=8262 RepID=A0A9N7W469_PLEPL|nr:unnamed protein product [Pleuronectes platessa]